MSEGSLVFGSWSWTWGNYRRWSGSLESKSVKQFNWIARVRWPVRCKDSIHRPGVWAGINYTLQTATEIPPGLEPNLHKSIWRHCWSEVYQQPAPPAVTLKVRHVIYIFIDVSLGFSCYFYVALHVKLCVSSYLFYLFYDCGHVFASQWRWFTVVDGRDWRLNIVCLVCDGSKGRCTAYDVVVGCWRHILNFISGSFAVTAETIVVIESYT